jgi:hypothetical protein
VLWFPPCGGVQTTLETVYARDLLETSSVWLRRRGDREAEMAKAILGSFADPRTLELLDEIRTLRKRVAALEAALEEAERARRSEEPLILTVDDEPVPAESVTA